MRSIDQGVHIQLSKQWARAILGFALSCTVFASPVFAETASPLAPSYDFSRWSPSPLNDEDRPRFVQSPSSASPQKPFSLSLNDLVITPETDASMGMVSAGETEFGSGLNFLSGGDTATIIFYSAGATLGVIGSNLKKQEDGSGGAGGGGNTQFLQDPSDFETGEFNNQYGLESIGAHYAYARGHTGSGVLVSVMDTPFNTSHANLDGALVAGFNPGDGSTNVALDCGGSGNPCQHGTHVAGIIAARKTDDDDSMHGVAYEAKVKPVAFLDNPGITTGQQQVDAFLAASGEDSNTEMQIVAMNNSWGPIAGFHSETYNGYYFHVPNETTITASNAVYLGSSQAAEADTIMVFAAGNDGWNSETGQIYLYASPSDANPVSTASAADIIASSDVSLDSANRLDSVTAMPINAPDTSHYVIDQAENEHMWLVVAATDQNDRITSFSNGCGVAKNFCLAAPGQMINSTDGSGSTYVELPGTSMAAPHVTGAIAILADMYPNLLENPENISQILLETATDLGAVGVDDVYGHGLLNLQDATGAIGDINIADSHFDASRTPYDGGAAVETPVAFGDALSVQDVMIGSVDKYERVFMLHLPVTTKDMASDTMSFYAHEPLVSSSPVKKTSGLSLIGDHGGEDGLTNAGLNYNTSVRGGHMNAQLQMKMDIDRPKSGADESLGYTRYFDAMAYASGTRERMAIAMDSGMDKNGQSLSTNIRLDRDDQDRFTLISSSTATKRLGHLLTSLTLGGISEEGRMMGGEMSGPLAVASSHTIFAKSKMTLPIGLFGKLEGFYEIGSTKTNFVHDNLVSADRMTTDSYGLKWQVLGRDDQQFVLTLHRPVAVTSGQIRFNTLTGYTEDGDYRSQSLGYNIAPSKRETAWLAEYRKQFFKGGIVVLGLSHQENANNIAGFDDTGGFMRGELEF